MVKVTQRERFMQLREAVAGNDELVEFIDGRIAMLDRKRDGAKGMTKEQKLNEIVKVRILDTLTEAKRANAIATELGDGIAVQKVTALLGQLVKAGEVVRVKGDKGVTLFERV